MNALNYFVGSALAPDREHTAPKLVRRRRQPYKAEWKRGLS
jgi:hypothetical protein